MFPMYASVDWVISSRSGWSHVRHQPMYWTNVELLSIESQEIESELKYKRFH